MSMMSAGRERSLQFVQKMKGNDTVYGHTDVAWVFMMGLEILYCTYTRLFALDVTMAVLSNINR